MKIFPLKIIGFAVSEAAGIQAKVGVMAEEERAAKFHPKGKGNPVVLLTIIIIGGILVGVLVDFGTDGERRRRRCQDVGDEGFVVASYGMVHPESVVL